MRRLAVAVVFLFACPLALAQHFHPRAASGGLSPCTKFSDFANAVDQPEFQKVPWVVTGNKNAQKFFNQGMTQYWGFNYEEAMRNFKMAKSLDANMAMASWGIALAAGPNINLTMDAACHKLANDEIKNAARLIADTPDTNCPKGDPACLHKDLITALQKRYAYTIGNDVEADKAYHNYSAAMAGVWQKYQDDPNAGALYAESLIDLHAWALFRNDGCPDKDAPLILNVLSRSIAAAPNTVGANHYWIHAVEASPTPAKALTSANLLQTLVAASGHLVHMSSHIYIRMGDYAKSLEANRKAVNDDVDQYGTVCSGPYLTYASNTSCPQLYYGHYLGHNYLFGSVSATFMGRSEEAMKLACATRAHVQRFVIYEPNLQRYLTAPLMTMVVNGNWDAVCAETDCESLTAPPDFDHCYSQKGFTGDSGCHILNSIWFWARGMALAMRYKLDRASNQAARMSYEVGVIGKDNPPDTWGNNPAVKILAIASDILNARIQWMAGNDETAIMYLSEAVQKEDDLIYDEPPQWFTPAREALGGAYLQRSKNVDAILVFKEELDRHPASGRALYGLARALQERATDLASTDPPASREALNEAAKLTAEFCRVWTDADYTMKDANLWPARRYNNKEGTGGLTCTPLQNKPAEPSKCTCPPTNFPNGKDLRTDQLTCAPK